MRQISTITYLLYMLWSPPFHVYKEYQETERNGFGPFLWNGTTKQGTVCHACWNGTENPGTVHGPERNGPERKWPYLDTTGLPEANDWCILHVSASSTTFVFLKKSKKSLQGCRPDPCPPPGAPPGRRLDRTGPDLTEHIGRSHNRPGTDRIFMGLIVIWNGTDRNGPDFP